jgi:arginyl-tRNA--protein-N-Asp/Glu arginylyltransferase
MKLVFSEDRPEYEHYVFPYAVWAFPEAGETAADFFERGFLPSARDLTRFYLCRQVRVKLPDFTPSSENRRILRKGAGISAQLVPRSEFEFTAARRRSYQGYADIRFGHGTMPAERLDALFASKITSHILLFTEGGAEVGAVTLFLQPPNVAYYYYAFYDLNYFSRNLGMFMMTSAVKFFAAQEFHHLYLGSCYTRNALYKTQFAGAQFFNGFEWSTNLKELKYLLDRRDFEHHLLESEDFRDQFHEKLDRVAHASPFRVATR